MKKVFAYLLIMLMLFIVPITSLSDNFVDGVCPNCQGLYTLKVIKNVIDVYDVTIPEHIYNKTTTYKCNNCKYEFTGSTKTGLRGSHTKGAFMYKFTEAAYINSTKHLLLTFSQHHCGEASNGCYGFYTERVSEKEVKHTCSSHELIRLAGGTYYKHTCQCGAFKYGNASSHY